MRYAILVDGSFLLARLRPRCGRTPTGADVIAECEAIRRHPALDGEELLRILFYDARPFAGNVLDPVTGQQRNLSRTETHRQRGKLLDELKLAPNFALRLGELIYQGFELPRVAAQRIASAGRPLEPSDLQLAIRQKGVDMRIGLDIARLSLREKVGAIVVTTGDSDFIPAFKFARREGVRVYLDHLGGSVKRELKAHADLLLER